MFSNATATNAIIDNTYGSNIADPNVDNGFTLYIKKAGYYWIDYCGINNSNTNQASWFYISDVLTSGYTVLAASSFTSVVNTVSVLNQIFYFNGPKYIMVNTNGN